MNPSPEQIFRLVQSAIAARVAADPMFANLAVRERLPGKFGDLLNKALKGTLAAPSGKRGLSLFVHTPDVKRLENTAGGFSTPVCALSMELVECRSVNFSSAGSHTEPSALAWLVFRSLQNLGLDYIAPGVTLRDEAGDGPREQTSRGEDTTLYLSFVITLTFDLPCNVIPRAARPKLASTGGATPQITLTCTTAEAEVYYTLGAYGGMPEYPGPRNGTLYTEPFELTEDRTLFAAAYKTGLYGSEVLAADIQVVAGGAGSPLTDDAGNPITDDAGNPITVG